MILSYTDALPGTPRTPRPYKSYISAANKVALPNTEKVVDKIAATAYVVVMCVNDIADAAVRDAVAELRATKYYKHDVKRTCKMCLDKYDWFGKRLETVLKDKYQFWMDLADAYSELMQPHITKLYWSIKNCFDRNFEPDASVKARLCTAEFMLSAASRNFSDYFDAMAKQHGVDVRHWFAQADLSGICRLWSHVCDIVLARNNPKETPIDLVKDENCALAGRIIANMMLSTDIINAAGNKAVLANPDVVPEGVDLEEYVKIM